MIRDKIKNKDYFQNYEKEEREDLAFYINNLEDGKIKEDRIIPVKKQIVRKKLNLFISDYSNGKNIEKLKIDYRDRLEDIRIYWNSSSGYVQMLWMLSIGIMLEADKVELNKLTELIKGDNPNDYLVDFLLNHISDLELASNSFKFPKPYQSLKEVITLSHENKKEEAVLRLKEYLDKEWYKGHSDTGWYESHKSKHNTYYGYWSFESGALVKILKLDDSILKDQQYYPYDMVHWKD